MFIVQQGPIMTVTAAGSCANVGDVRAAEQELEAGGVWALMMRSYFTFIKVARRTADGQGEAFSNCTTRRGAVP